ncbi:hypothetical protein J2S13_000348 [Oikeobacillus pervagus]|uniref:Uncharacterized protein n=1 Tax=Oikeobacillus pervagus TaxID=1325931 RepID=A0AAJ1SW62_9BACI|nr:hypothetical protein [Oikeobacillus pervagus]MDQ0213953.1 hypothetical protein [Oikeobacillus pervagus]
MPRGKELKQLPMANIAPGAGKDPSPHNRKNLEGIGNEEVVTPNKEMKEK